MSMEQEIMSKDPLVFDDSDETDFKSSVYIPNVEATLATTFKR